MKQKILFMKFKDQITEGEVIELIFWSQFVDPEEVKSFPQVLIKQNVTL